MYRSYSFTTWTLQGDVNGQRHSPAALYSRRKDPPPSVNSGQEAGWAPGAGLGTEVRGKILLPLPWIEPRSPGRPVSSQTLYCLS
jgi:hypothetical protein